MIPDMADHADSLIAIQENGSKGTQNMINIAKEKGLKVFTYTIG